MYDILTVLPLSVIGLGTHDDLADYIEKSRIIFNENARFSYLMVYVIIIYNNCA